MMCVKNGYKNYFSAVWEQIWNEINCMKIVDWLSSH